MERGNQLRGALHGQARGVSRGSTDRQDLGDLERRTPPCLPHSYHYSMPRESVRTFGGLVRRASSFGSVPHPGTCGTTMWPSSIVGARVNSSPSHGRRSTSCSMMRRLGTAAAKWTFIIVAR